MVRLCRLAVWLAISYNAIAAAVSPPLQDRSPILYSRESAQMQSLVTWDEYTIKVRGERVIFFSGEVHPFRLPSPGLWLDVFQKVRAMGFTGVSFYVLWALLEGEPGKFRAEGVFALEEFFSAASQAGIYLLARPGPYINAETSGGGYPGWLQRNASPLRTSAPEFVNATQTYMAKIGEIISKAQITNGGPIILVQPENEYSMCSNYTSVSDINACLDKEYMSEVESQLRGAGVVVPFLSNDGIPIGNFAPGTGVGEVDIYGVDDYPFQWGTGCENPSDWNRGHDVLRMLNFTKHMTWSPNAPFAVTEFQGGSADPWGGAGAESCYALVNHEFARVFNKILLGMRVTILNLYMIYGGTNWGNLGHQNGYTSYDGGSAIQENRQVSREKYSELKLQANFLRSSPTWATANPVNGSFGVYTDMNDLVVTPLFAQSSGAFYVVGFADPVTQNAAEYKLKVTANGRNITIPQLGGTLTLSRRDSKIHVTDYPIGATNLAYSTAEILSWTRLESRTVVILYGGAGETHEFAVPAIHGCPKATEGLDVKCEIRDSLAVIQWNVKNLRQIAYFASGLEVYLLWRNDAYNYWILDLPLPEPIGRYPSTSRLNSTDSTVIVKAGYLVRTASISGSELRLYGDINATTDIEVIAAPVTPTQLFFNNKQIKTTGSEKSGIKGTVQYQKPAVRLPSLSQQKWRYLDTLPEISGSYDDSRWTPCSLTHTNNTRNLTTPMSLYAGDYGYHSGSLLYRGHFKADGAESVFFLSAQGGNGFGHSVWLNSDYLGSWTGSASDAFRNQTFTFPSKLQKGKSYVLTVLIDHMGLHDNWEADGDTMRQPRGILDYHVSGMPAGSKVTWKMTGNLGGERYIDHSRGPLNEGSMYAERNGYHLPGAPLSDWATNSPLNGISNAGVGFFATKFDLDLPVGYDVPISLLVGNSSRANGDNADDSSFRLQLFVNGWQLGKYVSTLGPQNRYVIPEGILKHNGENYLAITLWALNKSGARIPALSLEADAVVWSGYNKPPTVEGSTYQKRTSAY